MNSIFVISSPIGGDTPPPLPQLRLLLSQNQPFDPPFRQSSCLTSAFPLYSALCTGNSPHLSSSYPLLHGSHPKQPFLLSHFQLFRLLPTFPLCRRVLVALCYAFSCLLLSHFQLFLLSTVFLPSRMFPSSTTTTPTLAENSRNFREKSTIFDLFSRITLLLCAFALSLSCPSLCAFVSLRLCVMLFLRL
jgi:hypothetical protein